MQIASRHNKSQTVAEASGGRSASQRNSISTSQRYNALSVQYSREQVQLAVDDLINPLQGFNGHIKAKKGKEKVVASTRLPAGSILVQKTSLGVISHETDVGGMQGAFIVQEVGLRNEGQHHVGKNPMQNPRVQSVIRESTQQVYFNSPCLLQRSSSKGPTQLSPSFMKLVNVGSKYTLQAESVEGPRVHPKSTLKFHEATKGFEALNQGTSLNKNSTNFIPLPTNSKEVVV